MKLYLDACCLNRPFDDQTQDRIRLETEAIILILNRLYTSNWKWVSSEVLTYEIGKTPDIERKTRVSSLLDFSANHILITPVFIQRAQEVEELGFNAYDALHLACAEKGEVDVFLTTDDHILH